MLTQNRQPIPILVYHQIAEAPPKGGSPFRGLYVSPAAFARQMAWLKLLGYTGLSMSALQPYLQGERSGKVVGITFDDGYQNNLVNALPVLVRHGFSSTCYAVSGLLGKTNIWDEGIGIPQTPLMDEGEIRQWVAGGQEIGSHTRSHVNLLKIDEPGCREEMVLGKTGLEAVTGRPVAHFCYPYGHYEARHVDVARELGFATATTTQRSRCHAGMDMLQLPRVPVFWLKIATAYEDRRKK
ncbi:MAG: polysaccharide deacetylase family protein [Polaromonas sp.]|nr:polysaccharide deacetylase family protein [Polaromonas sp.]